MPLAFSILADCFERLERTSSRRDLTALLARLLASISPDEVRQVTYLMQGRVGPHFEPVEFGLGERSMAGAIARALGADRDLVLAEHERLGDLGTVVLELANRTARPGTGSAAKPLTVHHVYDELRAIAGLQGAGSGERKIERFADLLKRVAAESPLGAKHLVRIPLGTARLGLGDMTILSAFAQSKLGSAKERPTLEVAYNRISDLGLVGETLWREGLAGVQALDVAAGRPIRPQLAERLPDAGTILRKFGGAAHVQWKYDGVRIQIHLDRHRAPGEQVLLFSRNLESMTGMFPEVVEAVLRQVRAESVILDAEALAYNPATDEFLPFQETVRRRRKHQVEQMREQLPIKAMVFDVMLRDGSSLLDRPLTDRLRHLQEMVVGNADVLQPEPGEIVETAERMQELFDEALSRGLEGLVVKRVDSIYQAGARNFNWVKLKKHSAGGLQDTIDCVLLGYLFGRGKRASLGLGALLVGVYDHERDEFVTVSKLGTGLSDQQWRELRQRTEPWQTPHKPARVKSLIVPTVWIEPRLVVEVLADEITRSPVHTAGKREEGQPGYALRFPRFVRLRSEDRRPEDATTVRELVELYEMQATSPKRSSD